MSVVLQYIFTVRQAACPLCPALLFNSSTTLGILSGLSPKTTVSARMIVLLPVRSQEATLCQPHASRAHAAPPSSRHIHLRIRCTLPPLVLLQYNVTVAGMDKSGRKTQGINMLQFKTLDAQRPPPRPTPAPGLNLTEARGLNPTRGMARVSEKPAGYFAQVVCRQGRRACCSTVCTCPPTPYTALIAWCGRPLCSSSSR